MSEASNAKLGKNDPGNRIGKYSIEKIKEIIKENPSWPNTKCREEFLKLDIQYISYPGFCRVVKNFHTNKHQIKKTKPAAKKEDILKFITGKSFRSSKEGYEKFKKETKIKLSYVYFYLVFKSNKNLLKPIEATPAVIILKRRTSKKTKKAFHVPQNVQEVIDKWDHFIEKNVRNILRQKFNTSDEDYVCDVKQDVYVELCKYYKPENYDEKKGSFTNFLYYILRNCVYKVCKEKQRDALAHSTSYNETFEDSGQEKLDYLFAGEAYGIPSSVSPIYSELIGSSTTSAQNIESSVNAMLFTENLSTAINELDQTYSLTTSYSPLTYTRLFGYLGNDYTVKMIAQAESIPESRVNSQKKVLKDLFLTMSSTGDHVL